MSLCQAHPNLAAVVLLSWGCIHHDDPGAQQKHEIGQPTPLNAFRRLTPFLFCVPAVRLGVCLYQAASTLTEEQVARFGGSQEGLTWFQW